MTESKLTLIKGLDKFIQDINNVQSSSEIITRASQKST